MVFGSEQWRVAVVVLVVVQAWRQPFNLLDYFFTILLEFFDQSLKELSANIN